MNYSRLPRKSAVCRYASHALKKAIIGLTAMEEVERTTVPEYAI